MQWHIFTTRIPAIDVAAKATTTTTTTTTTVAIVCAINIAIVTTIIGVIVAMARLFCMQ